MTSTRLLLAGYEGEPEGSPDTPILLGALREAGFDAQLAPWREASAEDYDLCLLHTTWDYAWHPQAFDSWLASWGSRLVNPLELVRWNSHKGYLAELSAQGIPVVPTVSARRGERLDLAQAAAQQGWEELVLKPAIGQGARETLRARASDLRELQAHADKLLQTEDVLLQPFLPSILAWGERSLMMIDGICTHAIHKRSAAGDWRVQSEFGGSVELVEATQEERAVARQALALTPEPALYARVDLVQHAGQPCVIELELVEPELFLPSFPGAATTLSEALRTHVQGQA
ncbi:MAG: glutathione synthase/RimK-type ligase-like ATP-grasp enzyme [Planctomycetota bacterium]|jgi:glutathione synthase/RimK-type ligase-like ATP-grasp enzyme